MSAPTDDRPCLPVDDAEILAEREACAKVVAGWLDEVRRVTRILVDAGITDGPAVDALRAAAGVLRSALDDIRARGPRGVVEPEKEEP